MKKNILYISKYFAVPGTTGSARAFWLTRGLAQQFGHNVTVLTSDYNHFSKTKSKNLSAESNIENFRVIGLRSLTYLSSRSLRRILSWIYFEFAVMGYTLRHIKSTDIVIASSPSFLTLVTGILLKSRFKCKFIVEIRDIWPLTLFAYGRLRNNSLIGKALAKIESVVYVNADAIIGTMPNLSSHVGLVANRFNGIHCIPQGCSEELIRETGRQGGSQALTDFQDKFLIAYSGSIGSSNSLETLLLAAKALSAEDKRIHFLIVGEGALKPLLMEKYGELGNVTFFPRMPQHELHELLSNCDVLYFSCLDSPLFEYGQSLNKLVDYMLAARPIIGSYSGFPTMINEAQCGILVPASDPEALVEVFKGFRDKSKVALNEMGIKGRNWIIKNRRYDLLTSQYNNVVSEMFGKSS
jgi:glycosyltransferase involved in cell wall biosynthesis